MLLVLRKRWPATILALLALLHKTPPAGAFEVRWICNVDGNWANSDCWSTGGVPSSLTPGANVVIGGTLPDADVTVTLTGGATVGTLTMEPGDTLRIHNPFADTRGLTVVDDITNDGSIVLSAVNRQPGTGGAAIASLVTTDGALINNTTGLLHFAFGGGSGTVRGQSTFTGDLVNHGTVLVEAWARFDKPGGEYLNHAEFDARALTITSGGTFEQATGTLAVNGLTLQDASTLTLTGGMVEMAGNLALNSGSNFTQQGGTLEHTSGTISNGTFNYLGGTITGTPQLHNATLNIGPAATEPASFVLRQNNTLLGDVHAGQTLTVDGSPFNAELTSANGFTNNGTIVLTAAGFTNNPRSATLRITDGTLANSATGVLHSQGSGSGGNVFTGDLVNDGTILIERSTTFDKPGGQYVNHGLIDVVAFGNLAITSLSTLTNHGLLRGRATLHGLIINDGRMEGSSGTLPLEINGWLTGPGELQDVRIAGSHAPGASAPDLEGAYTLTSAATLIADIGGTTPGTEHTQLDATGTVNLGGQLQVRSIDAGGGIYLPTLGEQFTILASANPINGAFTNTTAISIASGTRIDWDIMQLTNEVVLEAAALTPLVPGDYNGDGVVDAADYTVWRDTLGSSNLAADGNVDGVIDGDDYDVWRANFGAMGGSSATIGSSSHPVPEPTALVLFVVAGMMAVPLIRTSARFSRRGR